MFTDEFLKGFYEEMLWIEEAYKNELIDDRMKRSYGDFADGDYDNYHRVSNKFWLTYLRPADYYKLTYL